ncbi:MAG: DUF1553 domain-containing protein [Proteobacteria bacterium]|nr:DUF1553 domain-containing protein [Verrucomicrobiota bacterium]NBU09198.1 DUF1553 domain-containing protein [Pseudomonadota bacterium]
MNISLLVFRFKVVARCVAAVVLLAPLAAPAASAGKLQYNRDIKPLLSDNCFACHGPDANTRKAKLRLDTKEGFFGQTKSEGPLLVPGQPEKSALFKRLVTKDQGDLMPPPESHKVLKPEQIARIRQWIAEGAQWQSHWAFLKPERPPLPAVNDKKWGRNPLDAFVLARLEEKGLKPASEADRRTLARRLALDLTGLPPTVEQVEAFVTDSSPRYYERYVQQLLDSPHWGEHRGRAWLDAARYADTHGLHFDNYREMWPYRDWVIKAFNRNLPYDRFITEQLAGDLLAEATDDQRIATGFQRCAMSTNEGGTIDEENVALYASDRVQTIGWVFLGLTANCAGCHDHKFDPVTMKDFYSMAAFFRNTTQPPKDGNVKDTAPSIVVPQTPEDARRWSALPGEITAAKAKVDERKRAAEPLFKTWAAKAQPADLDADLNFPGLLVHVPLNEGQGSLVKGFAGQAADFAASTEKVEWKTGGRFGAAPVLTKQTHFKLGDFGDFERTNRFTAAAWVNAPRVGPTAHASLFGRMDSASNHPGWDLFQSNDEFVLHLVHQWPGNAIRVSTTGKVVKAGKWQHVAATYDGSGKGKGVKLYVDGVEAKLKVDNDTLTQSIHTAQALRIGQRSSGEAFEGGQLQDVRLYGRALSAAEVKTLHAVAPLQTLLALAPEKRTKAQVDSLFEHWLNTRDEPYKQLAATFAALEAERTAIKERNPVTHVQQEKMDSQPMARVLFRGQYDQPRDEVKADTFAALNPFPAGAPRNRLGLAQWLVAADQPLTARVTVNRFWQELFGTGLVKTTEDFGIAGEAPVNQALLDWLAVEFREGGWDVKRLFTLLVTSAAYRQSAVVTKEKLELDPYNRLLSRGPRFRMDAEMVRDYALSVSGLLVPKLGGASVRPYQPDGVWEAVAMPGSTTRFYKRDAGEALYRRSLYTFWKRAAPPALLETFNAPSREVSCTRRERTNTPLQALATLNDPTFVEAARRLAENALKHSNDPARAAEFLAQRVLVRPLKATEKSVIADTLKEAQRYYLGHEAEAKQLIAVGESKPGDQLAPAQLAALTLVANQVMNLDEVLNK